MNTARERVGGRRRVDGACGARMGIGVVVSNDDDIGIVNGMVMRVVSVRRGEDGWGRASFRFVAVAVGMNKRRPRFFCVLSQTQRAYRR